MLNEQNFLEFSARISPVIGGKKYFIPAPKLAPDLRKQRRLAFRNENVLYKSKSSLSGKSIISFLHPDSPFIVYSHDEWWSDDWDSSDYAVNYDFSRGFFEQFYSLSLKVPRAPLVNNKAENSPYCNFADGNKNCHMCTSANWNEDSYFCFCLVKCKDAVDCTWCLDSEIMYECTDCLNCYNLRFSEHCNNSSESAFLYDCIGVKNSIFCAGLRNSEYHIFNKPVSKEQFKKTFDYYFFGSHKRLMEAKKLYDDFIGGIKDLRKEFNVSSENVFGNNIFNSRNIFDGNDVFDSEDSCYLNDGLNAKDCRDVCFFDGTELCYESTSLIGYGYRFTNFCRDSMNLFYCDSCYGCKDCFGCIGLRNKQHCVFNKRFKKDDYENLVAGIISAMCRDGEWGEFFPVKYSLFAYSETLANVYYPLTEAEVIGRGWRGRQTEVKNNLAFNHVIPDLISDVGTDFCDKILECEVSGKNYKLILPEFKFYKRFYLPIPRKSPEERARERMSRRMRKFS